MASLAMLSISVYVSALQRKSSKPTVRDVRDLNRLLKWIQSHVGELGIRYVHLEPPVRLVVVSDSAFRAQDHSGLAMRGCLIMLASACTNLPMQEPWKCVALDWYSRRHTHVVQSTYAAELHAVIDAVGQGTLIDLVIHELFHNNESARQLARVQEAGELSLEIEAFIDAKGVLDSIAVDPIRIPTEKNLYVHALALRDLLTAEYRSDLRGSTLWTCWRTDWQKAVSTVRPSDGLQMEDTRAEVGEF